MNILFKNKSLIIVLLIVFISQSAMGSPSNYYVDSQGGNDGNPGTSQDSSWRTIDRVNMTALNAGDTVFFKRGGVYRGTLNPSYSGNVASRITYKAYGEGNKPVFMASFNRGETSDWDSLGNNIWASGFKEGVLGVEFITNTGFETASGPWYTSSSGGVLGLSFTRVNSSIVVPYEGNYCAKISVGSSNGNVISDIQFIFSPLPTKAVTWYKVSFAAKATSIFNAAIALYKAGAPYDNYIFNTVIAPGQSWMLSNNVIAANNPPEVPIDTTWQSYTLYIQTNSKAAIANGRLALQLGNRLPENESIYFDAISVRECTTPIEYFKSIAEDPSEDAGNIIFLNGSSLSCGKKVWNFSDLVNDKDFYYDYTNNRILLYSVGENPATRFGDMEIATSKMNIRIAGKGYLNFENLDLKYGGGGGISALGYKDPTTGTLVSSNNISIYKVEISYAGGGRIGPAVTSTVRAGNGIGFWDGANNIVIDKCLIKQIYDSGISPQGRLKGAAFSKMYFRNNIIDSCEQSFEIWQTADDTSGAGASSMSEIYFDHNTCRNAGLGWSHSQRPDPKGVHLLFYNLSDEVSFSNIYIRNNIFDGVSEYGIYSSFADKLAKITAIDYNCWNPGSAKPMLFVSYPPGSATSSPTSYSWSDYRTNFSKDANSIYTNPGLLSNGAIPSSSPAKDAAFDLGSFTDLRKHIILTDYIDYARPYNSIYDMGAFEYTP